MTNTRERLEKVKKEKKQITQPQQRNVVKVGAEKRMKLTAHITGIRLMLLMMF